MVRSEKAMIKCMLIEVQNYDELRQRKWFRFAANPDTQMVSLAIEFKDWVLARLQLTHGETNGFDGIELHWFEPIETLEARTRSYECSD